MISMRGGAFETEERLIFPNRFHLVITLRVSIPPDNAHRYFTTGFRLVLA